MVSAVTGVPVDPESRLAGSYPYLARLVSGDYGKQDTGERSVQLETMIAVRNLLKALAGSVRVMIVLEDLQWMDEASAKTLRFLLTNCATESPLFILGLYRPGSDADPAGVIRSEEN